MVGGLRRRRLKGYILDNFICASFIPPKGGFLFSFSKKHLEHK